MKIIHIPFCFHPDPVGGTEIYVEALACELKRMGVAAVIASPAEKGSSYRHNGLEVRRFAIDFHIKDLKELYGEGDPQAAKEFALILEEEKPDLVHLHALTRGISLNLVRAAKQKKIPVIFTYHTPTVSCQRGTLMRWGAEVCKGVLDLNLCTRCTLHGLGLPRIVADVVGQAPVVLGNILGSARLAGGIWTALRMRALMQLRHATFRSLMNEVDHIIALCRWTKELLIRNGVPSDKITVLRHGLTTNFGSRISEGAEKKEFQPESPNPLSPIRIAALGRLDPTKGFDILICAIRGLPWADLRLDIYGIPQGQAGQRYADHLQKLAAGDARIRFLPPLPADQIASQLRGYDLLAVPSQCLETGPLVILEAFAARIPVIGSNLGGIAELVKDGVNGLLVEPDSLKAWSRTFQRLMKDRTLLARLKTGIQPPRTMREVAGEMLRIYEALVRPRLRVASNRDGMRE